MCNLCSNKESVMPKVLLSFFYSFTMKVNQQNTQGHINSSPATALTTTHPLAEKSQLLTLLSHTGRLLPGQAESWQSPQPAALSPMEQHFDVPSILWINGQVRGQPNSVATGVIADVTAWVGDAVGDFCAAALPIPIEGPVHKRSHSRESQLSMDKLSKI